MHLSQINFRLSSLRLYIEGRHSNFGRAINHVKRENFTFAELTVKSSNVVFAGNGSSNFPSIINYVFIHKYAAGLLLLEFNINVNVIDVDQLSNNITDVCRSYSSNRSEDSKSSHSNYFQWMPDRCRRKEPRMNDCWRLKLLTSPRRHLKSLVKFCHSLAQPIC